MTSSKRYDIIPIFFLWYVLLTNHSSLSGAKCHHDVWNLLLQLFDEGHLTDSHGRKVDFRNVLVVMTSNIGAEILSDLPSHYKGNETEVESVIMGTVEKTLSPELLNRIDETILFNRLQREHMNQITGENIKNPSELYMSCVFYS